MRHEAGSRFVEGGVPLHHVRELLGHASIKTTDTYLNVTRIGLQDSMRKFDAKRVEVGKTCTSVAQTAVPAEVIEDRAEFVSPQKSMRRRSLLLARPAGLGTARDERERVAALPRGQPDAVNSRSELARPAGLEPATPGLEGPSSETSKKWPTFGDFESAIGYR